MKGKVGKNLADEALHKSYDLKNDNDRLIFFNIFKDHAKEVFELHFKSCKRDNCNYSKQFKLLNYYLDKHISELEINSTDFFTYQEQDENNDRLDKILFEIEKLRNGQELIYDDLIKEINDLKEMYHLGKKTWSQVLKGKSFEMLISGVLDKTIIKHLVEIVEKDVIKLIN
ncbi:MAG: hypothetical protein HS119_07325 [Flavobacteriales bacterium]|nr:hypothetical protein [Flavobacteriales bacterium]